MNVAVIGATGRIGTQIALEAHARGHMVTGISRGLNTEAPDSDFRLLHLDVFDADALRQALRGHDVLINAYRGPAEGQPNVADAAHAIVSAMRGMGIGRIISIGGAGMMEIEPGVRLYQAEGFPQALRSPSTAHLSAIDVLAKEPGLVWTVFSPAVQIEPGEKRGGYQVSRRLLRDRDGNSRISYADFAAAVVDEMEQGMHLGELVTAGYI